MFGMFPVLTYPQLSTGYFHTKNPKLNSNILSLLVSITTLYYLLHINRFTSQVCRAHLQFNCPRSCFRKILVSGFKGSLGNVEVHTAFPEERGLLPRTYMAVHNHVTPLSRDSVPSSVLYRHMCTDVHAGKSTHTHKK